MADKRVAIVDHSLSNLRSITNAVQIALGYEAVFVRSPEDLRDCGHVILPGVGSFGAAMSSLRSLGLDEALRDHVTSGRPLFGICLGYQLLFSGSTEHGMHDGLGIASGKIVRFKTDLHVPHVGWNVLNVQNEHPVFADLRDDNAAPYVYFVHSYYSSEVPGEIVAGTSEYDGPFVCSIADGPAVGTQFHPEKSGATGLRILQNFIEWSP